MGAFSLGFTTGTNNADAEVQRKQQLQDQQRQSQHDALQQQLATGAITAPQYASGAADLYAHEPSESRLSRIHRGLVRAVGMKTKADAMKATADANVASQPSPRADLANIAASAKSPQQLAQERLDAQTASFTQQGDIQNRQSGEKAQADHQQRVQWINQNIPEEERPQALADLARKEAGIAPKQYAPKDKTVDIGDGKPTLATERDGKYYDQEGKLIPNAKPWIKPAAPSQAPDQVFMRLTAKKLSGQPLSVPEASELKAYGFLQDYKAKLAAQRGAAYNLTKPMIVRDTENGNGVTVATPQQMSQHPGRFLPASEADKDIAKENLMQDISGTSQLTRHAITGLKQDFPADMKVKIAVAMRADDPHAALDQLLSSSALGSLTADQQDFLIATRQLAENAMAMRGILGAGQGSDDVRNAIKSTLPSLLSPDRQFALKQLDAFDATVNRLHRGVPKVRLNDTPMQGSPAPKSAAKAIVQHSASTGQYRYSMDGGRTWNAGQPPK